MLRPTLKELIDNLVVLQDVSTDVPVKHLWMESESCIVKTPSPHSPFRCCDLPDASPDIPYNPLPFDEKDYPEAFILSPAYQAARVARLDKIMGSSSSSHTLTTSSALEISFCDSSSDYSTAPLQGWNGSQAGDQTEDYTRSLYGSPVDHAMGLFNCDAAAVSMHYPSANWVPTIYGRYPVTNTLMMGPFAGLSPLYNSQDPASIFVPLLDPYAFTTPQAFWRNGFTSGQGPTLAPMILDQSNPAIAYGDVRCGARIHGGLMRGWNAGYIGGFPLSGT